MYIFYHISIFNRMRNVSDKSCRKIKKHILRSIFFPRKSCHL